MRPLPTPPNPCCLCTATEMHFFLNWPNIAVPGLALLGPIDKKFVSISDVYEPLESGQRDKCFISKGCAAFC